MGYGVWAWAVLFPLSVLWGALMRLRRMKSRRPTRCSVPVLSVGNLHMGGSGKTPIVVAIAEHFASKRPAVVSRGYRGALSKIGSRVDVSREDGPRLYGDEPWMIARRLRIPVYIGRDRRRSLSEIEKSKEIGLAILDDGFQHVRVARTVNLLLIGTDRAPEDSFCFPWGDLREPIDCAADATAILLLGADDASGNIAWRNYLSEFDIPIFEASRISGPVISDSSEFFEGAETGAFSGIARPERFFTDIARFRPGATVAFPDHHRYSERDLENLPAMKRWITTEKDYGKVEGWFRKRRIPLGYAKVDYALHADFWAFLSERLG